MNIQILLLNGMNIQIIQVDGDIGLKSLVLSSRPTSPTRPRMACPSLGVNDPCEDLWCFIYIYDIYTIYVCIYSGSMWFHVIPGGSIKSSQGKQSAAWNIKKTAVRLDTIIHYLTYLTIQNCRVKSAACGE